MSRRPFAVALALVLLNAGCTSDTALREAPPPQPAEEGAPGGPNGPGPGGGWPGQPPLPQGPWAGLDPGDMPDIYFVVAHGDINCCWNCDGAFPGGGVDSPDPESEDDGPIDGSEESGNGATDEDIGYVCRVDYAIVDLFGQVIADFALPGTDEGAYWTHMRVQPAGPGRFLAVAQGWNVPAAPAPGPEDGIVDEPYGGAYLPLVAFEIDAVAETTTMVAWQDGNSGELVLPATGRRVPIGQAWTPAQIAFAPNDPDWIYVWGSPNDCSEGTPSLRAVNRVNRNVLDRVWTTDDLFTDETAELGAMIPFALEPSLDDAGDPIFLLALSDMGCTGGFAPFSVLSAWSPTTGPAFSSVQSGVTSYGAPRPTFAGWSGGGALQVTSSYSPSAWQLTQKKQTLTGPMQGFSWNVRPGPVLDPAGPTFVVAGIPDDGSSQSDVIKVVHAGEVVWEIDRLRFGLQGRQVSVFDIAILPPWEE